MENAFDTEQQLMWLWVQTRVGCVPALCAAYFSSLDLFVVQRGSKHRQLCDACLVAIYGSKYKCNGFNHSNMLVRHRGEQTGLPLFYHPML